MNPPEEIAAFQQEMRDATADWQMIYYANAAQLKNAQRHRQLLVTV
jgi:hypothetical protein